MKKVMMLIQRNKNIVLWLCFLLAFSGSYAQTTINAVSNKGTILPMSSDPDVKTGALRDAYGNLKANNLINAFETSVSSGTPLVLSAASAQNQEFTGSVAQTVTLPDATGLVAGFSFNIINNSSTTMTVNSNVGGLVVSIPALNKAVVVLNTASVWTAHLSSVTANLTGPVTSVGNETTIANAAVTYNKIQNVSATDKVLGRVSAGEGVVEEISTTGSGDVVRATSPTLFSPTIKGSGSGLTTLRSINDTATPYTISLPNANGTLAIITDIVKKITTVDQEINTPAGNALFNYFTLTSQTGDATFLTPTLTTVSNPSIYDGNSLTIKIKNSIGASVSIIWHLTANYRGGALVLPTTIVAGKTIIIQFIYNANDVKWDLVSVVNGI